MRPFALGPLWSVKPSSPLTPPTADFSGTPQSGNVPLEVMFTDLSTGAPTAWQWDFQDNGSVDSTAQNPVYTYTAAGTYPVKLTVTSAGGSSTITKTAYIVVTTQPPSILLETPSDSYISTEDGSRILME